MNSVKLYTMTHCPYCVRAKKLLEMRNIPYQEINTDSFSDAQWEELETKSRMKTLPMIFHNDTVIGGYTQLAERDAVDQLSFMK